VSGTREADEADGAQGSEMHRHLRRNFWVHVFDGSIFFLGMTFASYDTILPVFIRALGGSNLVVASVPAMFLFGGLLPQLFVSYHVQRLTRKKGVVIFLGLLMRLPWIVLCFASLALGSHHRALLLAVTMIVLLIAAVPTGMVFPAWMPMVAATVPARLRGRLFSLRTTGGYLMGIGGGFCVRAILNRIAFPYSYSFLFAVAFVCFMMSLASIACIREPEGPVAALPRRRRDYVRKLPAIARNDRNFVSYVVARAFITFGASTIAFYSVCALERFGLSESHAGTFTIITVSSLVITSMPLGLLADRFGHKINLVLGNLSACAAGIVALAAPTIGVYYAVFFLGALLVSVNFVSASTIVVEMCRPEDRPTYIALSSILVSPVALLTLAMGHIADAFGYQWLFFSTSLLLGIGTVFTALAFEEPRRKPVPASTALA